MFARVAKLEKAFRRHPRVPLYARLAEQHLRKGRRSRARILCEEGCERFPEYATGFFLLGRCYEGEGRWEDARRAIDRGLRLDPEHPAGYRRLARVYRELGNETLALRCLERAAALDPLSETLADELRRAAGRCRNAETGGSDTGAEAVAASDAPAAESVGAPPFAAAAPMGAATAPTDDATDSAEEDVGLFDEAPAGSDRADDAAATEPADARTEGEPSAALPPDDDDATPAAAVPAPDVEAPDVEASADEAPAGEASENEASADEASADEPPLDEAHQTRSPAAHPGATDPGRGSETETGRGSEADTPLPPEWEAASAGPHAADERQPMEAAVPDSAEGVASVPFDPLSESQDTGGVPDEPVSRPEEEEDLVADAFADAAEVAALGEGLFDDVDEDPEPDAAAPAAAVPPAHVSPEPPSPPEEPPPELPAVDDLGVEEVAKETAERGTGRDRVSRLGVGGNEELVDLLQGLDGGPAAGDVEEERAAPVPTVTLAGLYADQGFVERATEIYQLVLATEPDNEAARLGLESLRGR